MYIFYDFMNDLLMIELIRPERRISGIYKSVPTAEHRSDTRHKLKITFIKLKL